MRIGQNPAKFVASVPQPARVTVVIITYIPFLGGYYAEMLDVLKMCLSSLWAHSDLPFDLFIFDNASCPEVRAYLSSEHEAGRIRYLVLSAENLGKAAAWNFVFAAAPGEIIAYADADIYFEQGWLSALVGVLDAFPNAGMVTGIPMWSPPQYSTATVAWAETAEGVTLERGKLLGWDDYWKHARSLGQEEAEARANYDSQTDMVLSITNLRSPITNHRLFIGAGHFQFVARKSVLMDVLPIEADKPMGQVRRLDVAINERGYLRLSTSQWWVRHLGNTLGHPELVEGLDGVADPRGLDLPPSKPRLRGPLRRLVQWVYHQAFEMLYRGR
jgi:hypothetical protein